jgi:phosphate-selective porin OprO/OprP
MLLALALPARAGDAEDIKLLREQLRVLEQKLHALERRQALRDEVADADAKTRPALTASDGRIEIASADRANSLRLRGLVQLDARLYLADEGHAKDAFVLRRARLISEGVLARDFAFQLVAEFGGGSASILDANLNVAVSQALQFKFGKFKSPVGLEQLQSDAWTFFNERSIASNLVPNRDLGIQAWGHLHDGRLQYAIGVFNGVADGASSSHTDFDNGKDLVARVLASPFKADTGSALQGLSFGLAGSFGRQETTAGRTAGYRTDGQQTFFAYHAATVADGPGWRLSPQFEYRHGAIGLLGEYMVSSTSVRAGAAGPQAELQHRAWQLAAGYVLTGEHSSSGGVIPQANFNPSAGAWGAFEVTARYASVKLDDGAFPLYAAAAGSASDAASIGLGLNWYLSRSVAFKFAYYSTDFGFNAAAPVPPLSPGLRQDEQVFISRFQLGF